MNETPAARKALSPGFGGKGWVRGPRDSNDQQGKLS